MGCVVKDPCSVRVWEPNEEQHDNEVHLKIDTLRNLPRIRIDDLPRGTQQAERAGTTDVDRGLDAQDDMATAPPTDKGGHKARPPDPPAPVDSIMGTPPSGHHTGEGRPPPLSTSGQGHLCGPHDGYPVTATPHEDQPAQVTTPSDALEGGGLGTVAATGQEGAGCSSDLNQGMRIMHPRRSYAAAVRSSTRAAVGKEPADTEATPVSLSGRWRPRERQLLLATLNQDWSASATQVLSGETAQLRQIALADTELHQDHALRQRTALETKALLAYLHGDLELPHAPTFLKATMPLLQRAMLEQFHETHMEVTLTADVSPRAKLRRNMTHIALFAQLYEANADSERGRQMIDKMMDDVKMLHFDGIHTLHFVFTSGRVARSYLGLAFRLQGVCIELEDSDSHSTVGTFRQAQLRRQYAVRVYGSGHVGLVALLAALRQLEGVQIVDAERPRTDSAEGIDNRFIYIRFLGTECPAALRGVTKIDMGGSMLTLHHHLTQPRTPCGRCYAPFHTTGFCKAKPNQIEKMRTKYSRTFAGHVPNFQVGEATLYKHSDGDSLATFLETLQGEVTADFASSSGDTCPASLREVRAEGTHPPTTEIIDNTSPTEGGHAGPTTTGSPAAQHPLHQDFESAKSKASRTKSATYPRTQTTQPDRGGLPAEAADRRSTLQDHAQQHTPRNRQPKGGTSGSVIAGARKGNIKGAWTGRTIPVKQPTFASFARARERGRFAALDDDEASSDGENRASGADDAPYAYASDEDSPRAPPSHMHDSHGLETTVFDVMSTTGGANAVENETEGSDMDCDDTSDASGYVGSSAPSHTQSPALTPGSEFPYSLDSELEDCTKSDVFGAPVAAPPAPAASPDGVASLSQPEVVQDAAPTLSQDGFEVEHITHAPGMPQQLPIFLLPFGGSLVTVPFNGQCAYAAFYASTAHVTGHRLQFTSDVVRGINVIKRSIYTLMMSNLAKDVDCGVVDPSRELERLYPSQPPPKDTAAATAALYNHYGRERSRSANTQIPSEFWAGPEVLRAMAQYLREPLFVMDVTANNDAHVQRYYYQEYRLKSGEAHESGCGGAVTDADAKKLLKQYERLHVLPVMMVLKRHEGHYYGVQHGGIAVRWHAEGDREFAETHCAAHPWLPEVLAHMDVSEPQIDGVDPLNDFDEVNTVIIGGMEHRDRLDIIHDRMHMPRLNGECCDLAELETRLGVEGDRLHRLAGPSVPGDMSVRSDIGSGLQREVAKRSPISSHGRAAEAVMARILDSIGLEPELLADRSKLRQLQQENNTAVTMWTKKVTRDLRPPLKRGGKDDLLDLLPWLLEHRQSLHSLFAYLPYPELAAKTIPSDKLLLWGATEVYDANVATLRTLLSDSNPNEQAAEYCRSWIAACTASGGGQRDRTIAGDTQRWERLAKMHPGIQSRARPADISHDCWCILHVLPYTLWAWWVTPMGKALPGHYIHHYRSQPAIQLLCEQVAARMEWGAAVSLPCGLTWAERLVSMEAGLAAQTQY